MVVLATQVWPDVTGTDVLVVPLGATEQHGPHLPMSTDTDTDIAVALAARLARRHPVTVAPALSYGSSGEHAGFPGTLSIGAEALELVLVELVRSATLTWSRVLLLTAHGGNAVPVTQAVQRLRAEGRDVRAWGPRWDGDAHAGRTETSVQLALGADVRTDRAAAGATGDVGLLMPAMQAGGVRAVSANGVLGDPAGASADEGVALLDAAETALVDFVSTW
ncbi:MAG: mftE [Frankiales bacterium]|nr:mftE [Frankiales bacterium]